MLVRFEWEKSIISLSVGTIHGVHLDQELDIDHDFLSPAQSSHFLSGHCPALGHRGHCHAAGQQLGRLEP